MGFSQAAVSALTATGLSLQESLQVLIFRCAACNVGRAKAVSHATNPIDFIAWRVWFPWQPSFSVITKQQLTGSRGQITLWDGVAPLAIIDTELGARQVENVLGRIGYGGVS
jgi:hypothetical protein